MKIGKIQETILYSRVKSKDAKSFIKVYDLYINQIYRFIYFKVSNSEEAEDLTSAVFLKTWSYIHEGNEIKHKTLKALIYKIARNLVIDHYRKSSRQKSVSLTDEFIEEIVDNKLNMQEEIELKLDMESVKHNLQELKDEYREAIVMRFVNELSISEIADI
ncbi:RNA polymerase sigma factor, partial [Candidatus Parcubacteria bacterium]|nr:RNA polymerase sigma factor [Candidatus Parcubacteria bacterium]